MPINDEKTLGRPCTLHSEGLPNSYYSLLHSEPPIYNQVNNLQLMPGGTTSQISTPL